MSALLGVLRFLLEVEGVALLIGPGYIAYRLGWLEYYFGIALPGVYFIEGSQDMLRAVVTAAAAGPLVVAAAAGLRGQRHWARLVTILASMANLWVAPPVGLAIGGFGLWVCFLPETRAILETWKREMGRHSRSLAATVVSAMGPVCGSAAFGGVGYLCSRYLPEGTTFFGDWRALIWIFGVAPMIEITLHELGHLALGLGVGMRFQSMGVGPVSLHRSGNDWRIVIAPAWGGGFAGARAEGAPGMEAQLRKDLIAFVAGGPLASILLAMASFSFVVAGGETGWEPLAAWIAAASSADFAFNLIPARIRGFRTDGAWLFELMRPGDHWRQVCAEFVALTSLEDGESPGKWSPGQVEAMTAVPEGSPEFFRARYFAAIHHLERDEPAEAERHLRRAAAVCRETGAALPAEIAILLAYVVARYHGEPAPAMEWMELAGGAGGAQRAMAAAAVAMAARHWVHAACRAEEALEFLEQRNESASPLADFEKRSLRSLRAEIERRARSAGSGDPAMPIDPRPAAFLQ